MGKQDICYLCGKPNTDMGYWGPTTGIIPVHLVCYGKFLRGEINGALGNAQH